MTSRTARRVTTKHLSYLAAGPYRAGGKRRTALVDTDSGIQLIPPDAVLAPGSGVRRLLLTRATLAEYSDAAGLSPSAYVRAYGGLIAADLNVLLAESA